MRFATIRTPIGDLLAVREDAGLTQLRFASLGARVGPRGASAPASFADVVQQLDEYFRGQRQTFELPLAPAGTAFQQAVWRAVSQIPYGQCVSYSELARRIGRSLAARAVGAANRANPLPILIPCHRVIGCRGDLTGYRGGLDLKQRLLCLEQAGL